MRLRRDIYILLNVSPRPPRALIQKPLFVTFPRPPSLQPRRATSAETNPSCRDPDCCFSPVFSRKLLVMIYQAGGDMWGLCVCVWSCNEFLEKEKAINDRGGFSAYNPLRPTVWHLCSEERLTKLGRGTE